MQPKGVDTVKVYVIDIVLSGNITKGLGLFGSLKNVLGVHSYRNESVGSAMTVGVRLKGAIGLQMNCDLPASTFGHGLSV
jgi:hypothetical protein